MNLILDTAFLYYKYVRVLCISPLLRMGVSMSFSNFYKNVIYLYLNFECGLKYYLVLILVLFNN